MQDAAQVTLKIQTIALEHGMSLKDASAYNVQFHDGKPVLIDTLSFEKDDEDKPWIAYRQFCQHFLNPLALMSHTDVRLSKLMRTFIDGIPLDLASRLLSKRTRLFYSLLAHIHLHAATQRHYSDKPGAKAKTSHISKARLLALIASLERAVKNLAWKSKATE